MNSIYLEKTAKPYIKQLPLFVLALKIGCNYTETGLSYLQLIKRAYRGYHKTIKRASGLGKAKQIEQLGYFVRAEIINAK